MDAIGGVVGSAVGGPIGGAIGSQLGGYLGGNSDVEQAYGTQAAGAQRAGQFNQEYSQKAIDMLKQNYADMSAGYQPFIQSGQGAQSALNRTFGLNAEGKQGSTGAFGLLDFLDSTEGRIRYGGALNRLKAKTQGDIKIGSGRDYNRAALPTEPGSREYDATHGTRYFEGTGGNVLVSGVDDVSQLYEQSPGYKYQQEEAAKAVQREASARGYLNSPRLLQQLGTTAQGIAAQDYKNFESGITDSFRSYQSRLANLSGQGLNAQNAQSQVGAQYNLPAAGYMSGIGDALANSQLSSANAMGQGQAAQLAYNNQQTAQLSQTMQGLGGYLGNQFGVMNGAPAGELPVPNFGSGYLGGFF